METVITILLILFIATLVRACFGFGDALVSMPLMTMVIGLKSATPLSAMVSTTIALMIIADDWKNIRFKSVWRLILSSAIGIPAGLFLLQLNIDNIMKLILAAVIILFSAYRILEPMTITIKKKYPAYVLGFLAGIFGGAYNTNGPFVVVYANLSNWTPAVFRATLQGYFIATNIIILTMHGLGGLWTQKVFSLYLYSLPILIIVTIIGSKLNHIIPKGKFDKAIYFFLIIIGFSLIYQSFR